MAAAITSGDVLIENAVADHVAATVQARGGGRRGPEHVAWIARSAIGQDLPTDIKTLPHPGFPTDMQQPFAALMCLAEGVSMITETLYESRFRYTTELERMGADIRVDGRTAKITGVAKLSGAHVTCTDLRAGAAMVCAALAAEGETEIDGLITWTAGTSTSFLTSRASART